jgi:hypothetical protein
MGNIMTTREGKKYKILTTKPKQGSSEDSWDVDVDTYKKAILIK